MIKGLSITPPVLGRISIGRTVERHGKRLPEKDDQFTITSQVQSREGWLLHPLDEVLRKNSPNGKLRAIPVTLLFNDPDLNLRAEYSMFDRTTGRPMCVGNGEACRRVTADGVQTLPCPSTDSCEMARGGTCKPYGRLNVKLGDDDELGTFVFRTTGYNSIRTLAARLHYFQAISGNLLACLPLELRLRGKSTTQSRGTPIYYADLTLREGMTLEQALTHAKQTHSQRLAIGYDPTTPHTELHPPPQRKAAPRMSAILAAQELALPKNRRPSRLVFASVDQHEDSEKLNVNHMLENN